MKFTPWYQKIGLSRRAVQAIESKTTAERNKELGARWEEYIRLENKQLRLADKARVEKIPVDLRPLHSLGGAHVKAVYGHESWVDFAGLLSGGRYVAFDAKATEALTFKPSQLEQHQGEILRDVERMGGLAFVYVFGGDGSKHVIPIGAVEKGTGIDLRDHKYMKSAGETWLETIIRIQQ